MGRKSSAKSAPPATPPVDKKGLPFLAIAGVLALAVVAGALLYTRSGSSEAAGGPVAANVAAPSPTDLKPHQQANLPPLQFPSYPMPRPAETVSAAYKFAAEHPEVLTYIPCFCGCENGGHRGNEDCFVKARDINGDVVEWQDHGMECAVCLDVATKARQLYTSGASVADIRAAIEKDWAGHATNHTPTPDPPHAH